MIIDDGVTQQLIDLSYLVSRALLPSQIGPKYHM